MGGNGCCPGDWGRERVLSGRLGEGAGVVRGDWGREWGRPHRDSDDCSARDDNVNLS